MPEAASAAAHARADIPTSRISNVYTAPDRGIE